MRPVALLICLLLLAACAERLAEQPAASSEVSASTWTHGGMVAVANPYAARAAADVLAAGGHAVDAAIAAHAVLGLVEPQSSGIGGGAFMLVYDRDSGAFGAFDGRETAPAGASADMFLEGGEAMDFLEAWQSGLSVGVPGVPALYEAAHEAYGRLDFAELLAPAIELAQRGFVVSPRLAGLLERMRPFSRLDDNPETAAYFYPGGKALSAGDVRDNPAYAETLTRLAAGGSRAIYQGPLAEEIVAAVGAAPRPGSMTTADLAGYAVSRRDALCAHAGAERVCSMPPPSSGLSQIMILNLYDRLITARDPGDRADRQAAFVDAQRLAYADRDHYVADADFVAVPTRDLIDAAYLDARAGQRVAPDGVPTPGDPGAILRGEPIIERWGRDTTESMAGTTHISIVDTFGNAVAMTASVEAPFGSSRWAGGFLLNNQLTDFARQPVAGGTPVANTVAPGKRPRSSMSPVIVLDGDDRLLLVTGSPGGNSIVAYVAKTLVGVLRWELTPRQAVDGPNVVARGTTVRVETGVDGGPAMAELLATEGYPVQEREGENSGLHVVLVTPGGLQGAADPRREGEVIAVPAAVD
jgi:gamma-glutamyltranspeptidase/glutathione hydrolase